jgi:uncharacterized protein
MSAQLESLLEVEPVIALHGPRSVGKSTLLRELADRHGVGVIDLDDLDTRRAAVDDPGSPASVAAPVCIDEYQHEPRLLDALKARLNREGSAPGTAVITGSTRQDALPRTAQSLTGRLHSMTIWPLSQGELAGVHEDLLTSLAADPFAAVARHPLSTTTREDYVVPICAGGFPLALARSASQRSRWFADYVRQCLERDALELTRLQQRQALAELLGRVAGQTAQVLNVTAAAEGLSIPRRTAEDYVRLLEDLFLVSRLPAWGRTLRSRARARPKVHVVDSGVAAHLMGLSQQRLVRWDPAVQTEFGHLVETFVVGELRKQVSWLDEPVTVGHWRTGDGAEVDFVVEFFDGSVIAFEIKSSRSAGPKDFRGLRSLRSALGGSFTAGILFNTGAHSYTHDESLHVMPIDRLWRPCARVR